MYEGPRADVSAPSHVLDFWPANNLASWEQEPAKTFLSWLSGQRIADRQFRESSRETYTAMFAMWVRHLGDRQLSLLEATPMDATDFFAEQRLEPNSRRRYLQLLEKVYCHLRSCGLERQDPLQLEFAKERSLEFRLPAGLDGAAQEALIRTLCDIEGWKGMRDRAMAALLLGAGLRTNELVHLPVNSLSESHKVRVEPMGVHHAHTTLVLPEGPWRKWLREWRVERVGRSIPGSLMCPATLKGTAYSPSGLFRRVSGWLDDANVESRRQGAGILRNSFARTALTCGRYKPEEVQEFLGHQVLRTTVRHKATEA
jgi:site-specific recombinase XerD